jgi:hypothetical protein
MRFHYDLIQDETPNGLYPLLSVVAIPAAFLSWPPIMHRYGQGSQLHLMSFRTSIALSEQRLGIQHGRGQIL